jgi:hypothetical protein
MVSIKAIGEVLGYIVPDEDAVSPITQRLRRIAEKVKSRLGDKNFEADVLAAEQAADEEGSRAMMQSFFQVNAAPPEREYKIKRVAKGQRINVVSDSGVRYSFGPVWVDSVIAAKGLAMNEAHREKLNMHGTHLGIQNSDKMSARELCVAIAALLPKEA